MLRGWRIEDGGLKGKSSCAELMRANASKCEFKIFDEGRGPSKED
jgi:hypothetical protein